MGKVILDMTMSLDGFTAGPDIALERPLGIDGERLHAWMFGEKTPRDTEIIDEQFKTSGAFIMGRRTFDVGIDLWGPDGAFGMPCFVLTHRPHDVLVKGPTTFTFVTDGITSALEQARTAAGDKHVCVMGAADVAHQYLAAGLIDEIYVHIVPLLFGSGVRVFDDIGTQPIKLEIIQADQSPNVTHLHYRVIKS